MRPVLITLLAIALGGCTALLVGGGNGGAGLETDVRPAAQVSEDSAATAAVMSRLAADPLVSRYDIRVETYAGKVTLRGSVASSQAKGQAQQIASDVEGVVSVRNDIQVEGAR